ncbi:MAG: amidohydrolase family protein [Acidobacteria bacterium]|nr:amidohydrolase family protein [Acidobacteriota bacterium]
MRRYDLYLGVALLVGIIAPSLALAQRVEVPRRLVSYPDLIVHNAQILTVDDKSFTSQLGTVAQAMAVRDGKILAVGSNAEILELKGPSTKVIDLKGRMVMPGMINTHDHPYYWAVYHEAIAKNVFKDDSIVTRFLHGTLDDQIRNFEASLTEAVSKAKPGQWVYIVPDEGPKQEFREAKAEWLRRNSTREILERLAPNNPVAVGAGTPYLVNSLGLEEYLKVYGDLDQYSAYEGDVAGARKSHMMSTYAGRRFLWDVMFKDHLNVAAELARQELSWFAGYGNTTIASTFEGFNALAAHAEMDREGKLPVRIAWGYSGPIFEEPFFLRTLAAQVGKGSDHLWLIGAVPEAVLGSCTTLPGRTPQVKTRENCVLAPGSTNLKRLHSLVKAGVRIGTLHTGGDQDIEYMLRTIVEASKEGGLTTEQIRAKRHAFDHCDLAPRPDQILVLKELGIIASCSDNQIWENMQEKVQDYGERAAMLRTPRKSMTDAGVMHTLELDEPLGQSDYNAFFFFWQGMTRIGADGKTYAPMERVSREIMLKTATTWASYYVLREKELGSLEPGKFADFIVLDRDILKIPEEEFPQVRVLLTAVGGKIVHLAPPLAAAVGLPPTGAQVQFGPPRGQTGW